MLGWFRKWKRKQETLKDIAHARSMDELKLKRCINEIEILKAITKFDYVLERSEYSFGDNTKKKEDYLCLGNLQECNAALWIRKQPDRFKELDSLSKEFRRFEAETQSTLYSNACTFGTHRTNLNELSSAVTDIQNVLNKGSKCKTKNG